MSAVQKYLGDYSGCPLFVKCSGNQTRSPALAGTAASAQKMPFQMGMVSRDLDFEGLPIRILS